MLNCRPVLSGLSRKTLVAVHASSIACSESLLNVRRNTESVGHGLGENPRTSVLKSRQHQLPSRPGQPTTNDQRELPQESGYAAAVDERHVYDKSDHAGTAGGFVSALRILMG